MMWRIKVAEVAGFGDLRTMENFYGDRKWPSPEKHALVILLKHSDFQGELYWQVCGAIADHLESVLPALRLAQSMEGLGCHVGAIGYGGAAEDWVAGLRLAAEREENVVFHG